MFMLWSELDSILSQMPPWRRRIFEWNGEIFKFNGEVACTRSHLTSTANFRELLNFHSSPPPWWEMKPTKLAYFSYFSVWVYFPPFKSSCYFQHIEQQREDLKGAMHADEEKRDENWTNVVMYEITFSTPWKWRRENTSLLADCKILWLSFGARRRVETKVQKLLDFQFFNITEAE